MKKFLASAGTVLGLAGLALTIIGGFSFSYFGDGGFALLIPGVLLLAVGFFVRDAS